MEDDFYRATYLRIFKKQAMEMSDNNLNQLEKY